MGGWRAVRAEQYCNTPDIGFWLEATNSSVSPQSPTHCPVEFPEGQGFYVCSVWEFSVAIWITYNLSSNACSAQVCIYWPEGFEWSSWFNTCVKTSSCLPPLTLRSLWQAENGPTLLLNAAGIKSRLGQTLLSQKRPAACKIKGVLSIATVLLSGAVEGTPSGCMQDSSYGNETQIKKAKYCKNNLFY